MVSLTKETVVLIGKVTAPDGGVAWTGPIFLSGRSWGAGCTLGEWLVGCVNGWVCWMGAGGLSERWWGWPGC
jgi:hypothetical protein